MSRSSLRGSLLLCVAAIAAFLLAGCKEGPTPVDQRLADNKAQLTTAEADKQSLDQKLRAREQDNAKLQGQVEAYAAGGGAGQRQWDVIADIDVATSLLSDCQNDANGGRYDEALPKAKSLADVLGSLKAELPSVQISLCLRRAIFYLGMANDLQAKGALIDALAVATTSKKELQPLLPAVAKDLQDIQSALDDQGRERARERAKTLLKTMDGRKEKVLVDQCLGSAEATQSALQRHADYVVRAELAQMDQWLKDLRYQAQTVRAPEPPAPQPGATEETTPSPSPAPGPAPSATPAPGAAETQPSTPAPSEGPPKAAPSGVPRGST